MNSDGSNYSSDSEMSDSLSDLCSETDRRPTISMPRRTRRTSVTSVSTNPEEDAYVMVLQNKNGLFRDFKAILASRDLCDVTFLVGEQLKPVIGIRAIIAARSSPLYELILSHEQNMTKAKKSKINHLKKKMAQLACASGRRPNVPGKLTVPIETFDYESFQKLIIYIHCGTLTVDARSVVGLLNAAVIFGLPELRQACWDFALGCSVREDNLQDLLESAKRYSRYQITKDLFKTMKLCTSRYPQYTRHSRSLDAMLEQTLNLS